MLRSPEIRAEMMLRSTGANRSRVRWEDIQDIQLPYPDTETASSFLRHVEDAEAARAKAQHEEAAAAEELASKMLPNEERANLILDAFKPPK